VPLHRVERAVAGSDLVRQAVGVRIRIAGQRQPEARNRDRRFVVVLLEVRNEANTL
jgi:hypothetical protein